MDDPVYSVVIPVFNSTVTLPRLVDRLEAVFTEMGVGHEVIFVDDCSPNIETLAILKELTATHQQVHCVRLARNFGKAGAVLCGMSHISGQFVITIDDDLQHAPEDIPILVAECQHDVVIGAFQNKKKHSVLQIFTSWVKRRFEVLIFGDLKGVKMSPYKLFKAAVVENMLKVATPHPFIPALMLYATRDVVQVEITHHPRQHGQSGFNIRRRIRQFSNLLFGNSWLVLKAMAYLGFSIALLSFVYGGWLILSNLIYGRAVPGWTSLMVATLILGGFILFSLGIIGEYLIRIIEGVAQRPPFLVGDTAW